MINKLLSRRHYRAGADRGDTIVEVLIAIAIAGFAIGTCYAIANQSLQQAILAGERNQALNLMQSQLAELQYRYQTTTGGGASFETTTFATTANYCLLDATAVTDANWSPTTNPNTINGAVAYNGTNIATGNYKVSCVFPDSSGSNQYYVNIHTFKPANPAGIAPTTYYVSVQWEALGNGPVNQASIYYRF